MCVCAKSIEDEILQQFPNILLPDIIIMLFMGSPKYTPPSTQMCTFYHYLLKLNALTLEMTFSQTMYFLFCTLI